MARPSGHGMRMSNEKPKNTKKTIKQLLQYLKPYRIQLFVVIIFAIGATIFMIAGPKILAKATDELVNGIMRKINRTGNVNMDKIIQILLLLLGIYGLSALFQYIQGFIVTGVAQKMSYSLREDLSKKMNKLPLSYFDKHTSGDILSRVTNDIDTIAQSINQSLSTMITSIVTVVGVLAMMLSISVSMTLIALVVLPVSFLLMAIVMKKSQKYYTKQQVALGDIDGHIEEIYASYDVVKAFNGENEAIDKFEKYNKDLYESNRFATFFGTLMMPIVNLVGNAGYVFVCVMGGYLASQSLITIGDIQAFIQYVRSFNQPVAQLSQVMNLLQSTLAASERVFEFLNEAEQTLDTAKVTSEEVSKIKGSVTFDHVEFGYSPDKTIIHDFNFHIHHGQKVAIVGPTGAGKTTIVKLLMRFYELNKGSILIDGIDIKDLSRHDLRNLFGMVLQDTWLFNGTIKENLEYGNYDASEKDIEEACKNAYVDHFVHTLSDGYDTMINEESSNISNGQKQLLTIARAFIKDPKILILDEATSSVDTRTELLIQQGMEKLMEGRTSFIIAHRLSTIRDANTIIVMKDGDIVEIGDHQSLLDKNGFYASLYQAQFESADA